MSDLIGYVKCYDTLKREYVLVPVDLEIETYIKRSYWREDMQNRRYAKRMMSYEYLVTKQEEIEEGKNELINGLIKQYEIERLKEEITKLDTRYREIIHLIYYERLTLAAAAKEMGLSTSYMSRLVKKINGILKENLEKNDLDE